ncbi:FAD-dependent pyridine nucleotide-disulfide oxidoreductase [Pyrolobus fumarii 1A]|uniref:FAD-dependent pyridine nucleotide-disulfide oxidoreductase n=1 Tax=Pyrolobus fumarii (strain DSM 11204 / 1A) TaxID=694429 RepID=G0EEI0_PYRF1|nr:FAD-dependent oxidoreductase [Pyrolobus fumarii]AEM38021.1 FAD-dependent pyridine nucleotide-disulfide oxidoreductase [Pyrolobus fumarii 1A]
MKSVVVVGSGFAGVEAVSMLGRLCGEKLDCIWVSANGQLVFLPALPEVAGGRLNPEDVAWSVERYAKRNGFQLVKQRVTVVEQSRIILENGEQISYDYLLLATGASPAFFNIPGAREHSIPLYTVDAAVKIRDLIDRVNRIVIVGAGLVGVEVAAEAKIRRNDIHVTLVDMMDKPLAALRNDKASRLVQQELEKLGIETLYGARVTAVKEGVIETTRGSIEADIVIWAAGLQACTPEIRVDGIKRVKGGYLSVDPYLRVAGNIFAAGDVTCVECKGCYALKMVREAMRQGKTAARNIVTLVTGSSKLARYKPLITDCRPLAGVTLGPKKGVLVYGKKFALKTGLVGWYKEWQRKRYASRLTSA